MKMTHTTASAAVHSGLYNELGMEISYNAYHALYAARLRKKIGRYMAAAYCLKRKIPFSVYRLACQLVASEKVQ